MKLTYVSAQVNDANVCAVETADKATSITYIKLLSIPAFVKLHSRACSFEQQ